MTTVESPTPVSRPVLEACAPFGLVPTPADGPSDPPQAQAAQTVARTLIDAMPVGTMGLLTGPSGCGKSLTLDALGHVLRRGGRHVIEVRPEALADERRTPIDLLSGPVHRRMSLLARAGLGEARLFARSVAALSMGERWRLALALAFERAGARGARLSWILADEFASMLDRPTAEAVGRTALRWATSMGGRIVGATAHADMPDFTGARCVAGGPPAAWVAREPPGPEAPGVSTVSIEAGTMADYDALAHLHYRAGRPGVPVGVLRALRRLPGTSAGRLAGVLVVSMPVLNASWRDGVWRGRYTGGCKRTLARRVNAELRCISRVIVEPTSRGLGIARGLVRAYLDHPQTPRTEAIAHMGWASPFFERAGMTGVPMAPSVATRRLLDLLEARALDPLDLLHPARADEALADRVLARALDTWIDASAATRWAKRLQPGEALRLAICRAACTPMVYGYEE